MNVGKIILKIAIMGGIIFAIIVTWNDKTVQAGRVRSMIAVLPIALLIYFYFAYKFARKKNVSRSSALQKAIKELLS